MSIAYWWSEDRKWFCILADDGVCKSTVSLTQKESRDLAAAIDRLDVKAETSPGDVEAHPSDHVPSNLLFYGLADAIGLSAKLRFSAGGTIKHEFDRNDIKQLRDVLRPKAEAKSQEAEGWLVEGPDIKCFYFAKEVADWKSGEFADKIHSAMKVTPLYTHPTTKPEAPAVSVDAETIDAVARIIDPTAWKMQDGYWMEQEHAYEAISKATTIAAFIAGGR